MTEDYEKYRDIENGIDAIDEAIELFGEKPENCSQPEVTKKQFMIQYVLNRSLTCRDLDGEGAAKSAEKAWRVIDGSKP